MTYRDTLLDSFIKTALLVKTPTVKGSTPKMTPSITPPKMPNNVKNIMSITKPSRNGIPKNIKVTNKAEKPPTQPKTVSFNKPRLV